MRVKHCAALAALAALGLLGWLSFRPVVAQGKEEELAVDRYRLMDLPVGRFTYRFMIDSYNGDHWIWVNGEWERPEPAKNGTPWKDLKQKVGRFHLMPQVPGELDAYVYVMDTSSGRIWARPARNRTQLMVAESWTEIKVPGRTIK